MSTPFEDWVSQPRPRRRQPTVVVRVWEAIEWRARLLLIGFLIVLAALTTGCASIRPKNGAIFGQKDETNERITKALTEGSLQVVTRLGSASGCPVMFHEHVVILTSAHVVDPLPMDKTAPLVPVCWSDASGNEGLAIPIIVDKFRDLAILELRRGTPGSVFALAQAKPAAGSPTWTLGYDFSSRSKAFAQKVVRADVLRTMAGHVVLERDADHGSSGGCVLNGAGEAVALNSWMYAVGFADKEHIGFAVGLWGDWLSAAEEK